MTGLLLAAAIGPDALAWLTAVLAAAGGMALHLMLPPQDPDVAEALLAAAGHP